MKRITQNGAERSDAKRNENAYNIQTNGKTIISTIYIIRPIQIISSPVCITLTMYKRNDLSL